MELKMMNDEEEIYIKCPQPVAVVTPVNNGLTYILDMFDLDLWCPIKDNSGRKASKSPTSQQNDNAKQNHGTDNGTQGEKSLHWKLEDMMNH